MVDIKGWIVSMGLKEFILDFVFPKKCLACGQEGDWACPDCLKTIQMIKSPSCPFCGRLTKNGQFCSKCRPKTQLTGIIIVSHLNPVLRAIIHGFKYDFVREAGEILSLILTKGLVGRLPHGAPILVPVPLYKRREAWRGFNQAEILARGVSFEFNLPLIETNLLRVKNTKPQIKLSREERFQNIKDAFLWRGKEIRGEVVLLVDDICTTSATLNECAKTLRRAGARQVWGVVLAKE